MSEKMKLSKEIGMLIFAAAERAEKLESRAAAWKACAKNKQSDLRQALNNNRILLSRDNTYQAELRFFQKCAEKAEVDAAAMREVLSNIIVYCDEKELRILPELCEREAKQALEPNAGRDLLERHKRTCETLEHYQACYQELEAAREVVKAAREVHSWSERREALAKYDAVVKR